MRNPGKSYVAQKNRAVSLHKCKSLRIVAICQDGQLLKAGRKGSCPLHNADLCIILNHMVQYLRAPLDTSFAALADSTRRGILVWLGRGDASITHLANKFQMTLTGMKKHVGVLEEARLVTTEKIGRVRTCKLGPRRLEAELAWIERYRQLWDTRFDTLEEVVQELKQKDKVK